MSRLTQSFSQLFSLDSNPLDKKLNLRFFTTAMVMMVARAVILLTPIFYAVVIQNMTFMALLNESLFYHLYYLLAFFDLLCFVETYYMKKQLEADPTVPTTWGFFLTVFIAQAITLNAMSVGMFVIFLVQNKGKILLKEKLRALDTKRWILVAVNALVLAGALAIFFYMLYLYASRS